MKDFKFLPENVQWSSDDKYPCIFISNHEFIPLDIGLSDFMLFFTLIRMQIALEEMKRVQGTLLKPKQLAILKQELDACNKFYEQYLSTFN